MLKMRFISLCLVMAAPSVHAAEPPCVRPISQTPPAEILSTIAKGHLDQLRACGLDVNAQLEVAGMRVTPLLVAAGNGHVNVVEQLLSAGADPNLASADDSDTVPLEVALSVKDYASALMLVRFGAHVDQSNALGIRPLMLLVMDPKQPAAKQTLAELLLQKGADINTADKQGNTALHWAARRGNLNSIQWLLSKNALPCARDARDRHAHEVIAQNSPDFNTIKASLIKACPPQDDL